MKVRRFTASSMQKALKTVRDEMGPDAVILSNHRVNGGVEIIVAQNYEPISAKKSAPVFENDEFEDQVAAKAQPNQGANKNENPWPFLNATERHQVEEQLKLQDQLETLKRQREGENHTASKPQINVSSQSDLQNSLQKIKQQRQDPSQGYEPVKQQSNMTDSQSASVDLKEQQNQKILHEVRNELNDLKDLLVSGAGSAVSAQSQNFVWKKFGPANSLQAKLWQRLEQMGFEEWLIYQLTHQIKSHADEQQAWQTCLHDLALHIQINPSDRLKRGGIFALVGPTGAGKTTTIAKMAVRYTLDNDGAKVGLITMDNYRLAAHDQLRTLGQILGVPVQVADQDHPLSQCIKQLEECDLILIDTAGLTPEHPMLKYQLDQISQLNNKVNTLLTLPATSSSRVLRKVYHNYKSAKLNGCILTKVDEASSLGDALSMLLECKLSLAYSTDGQRIPDDFDPANAKYLVKQAVKIAQHEQQYTPNQDVAAGAW
ncbi:flagellar biosynthesis protein FlhF [Oceaniserpentilla sp. 4NH20-0058]|uniref:flagellar biosynthesis protein FlhF n=1 Tax=Oceaniserpentilla sp. 4NH20-0058 TaxID=3127660 RepID=UPI003104B129